MDNNKHMLMVSQVQLFLLDTLTEHITVLFALLLIEYILNLSYCFSGAMRVAMGFAGRILLEGHDVVLKSQAGLMQAKRKQL